MDRNIERYDHNANNVTGTKIDWENDLIPVQLYQDALVKIEILKTVIKSVSECKSMRCDTCRVTCAEVLNRV